MEEKEESNIFIEKAKELIRKIPEKGLEMEKFEKNEDQYLRIFISKTKDGSKNTIVLFVDSIKKEALIEKII